MSPPWNLTHLAPSGLPAAVRAGTRAQERWGGCLWLGCRWKRRPKAASVGLGLVQMCVSALQGQGVRVTSSRVVSCWACLPCFCPLAFPDTSAGDPLLTFPLPLQVLPNTLTRRKASLELPTQSLYGSSANPLLLPLGLAPPHLSPRGCRALEACSEESSDPQFTSHISPWSQRWR